MGKAMLLSLIRPDVLAGDIRRAVEKIEAEAVARDREALAAKVRTLRCPDQTGWFIDGFEMAQEQAAALLAATPSPAPTDREAEVARIAAALYEATVSYGATPLAERLYDAGLRSSPAPTAPLDVELLAREDTLEYDADEQWIVATDRNGASAIIARDVAPGHAARFLATPDQRHG